MPETDRCTTSSSSSPPASPWGDALAVDQLLNVVRLISDPQAPSGTQRDRILDLLLRETVTVEPARDDRRFRGWRSQIPRRPHHPMQQRHRIPRAQ
ncbi:hypothetical protein [Streptomyces sp. 049-1]|uniref:hypothetical protein n=1 Tax=Streptomyces sp. 049-1 TaxID=2789264 RepID=UPI00398055BC